jgi:hypothetical protein
MRFSPFFNVLAPLAASVACLGCATPAEESAAAAAACPDPRPQVCTMIYAPVCAVHSDGSEETLASACNACADETVVDFRDGACEDDSL